MAYSGLIKTNGVVRLLAVCGLLASAFVAAAPTIAQAQQLESPWFGNDSSGRRGPWSVMVFGGPLSEGELSDIIIPSSKGMTMTDTGFIGAAVSKEVWRWKGLSVELEGGVGYQFGDFNGVDNSAAQVWGAAYAKYDDFPWNHFIHTSIGGSVGINITSDKTAFENAETKNGDTVNLLHYFSPEISFALPSNLNNELVLRLHHRSSASGAFGCEGCGANFITVGIRRHF